MVFDSADPDYHIAPLDVDRFAEVPDTPGAASLSAEWHRFVTELAHSPVISIASIRGRARGIGIEFVLACDMRFASKEKAILAQPEVGFGVVPGGGGGLDWLPRVAGRSRALEIITGGQDFDGDTAERYGLVNRALPDAQLDSFVDALATRIGGFERRALATAKRIVNERSPVPAEGELLQSFRAIMEAITWPEAHARMAAMRAKGWGTVSDGELNHPGHLGVLTSELAAPGPAPPAGPLGTCPASERSPAAGQSRVSCALRDAWLISFRDQLPRRVRPLPDDLLRHRAARAGLHRPEGNDPALVPSPLPLMGLLVCLRGSGRGPAARPSVRHRLLARACNRLPGVAQDRKLAEHRRSSARRAVHGEGATECLDPVLQPDQPGAADRIGAAGTVVTHAHPQRATEAAASTSTTDACACLVAFVRASETT